MKISIDQLALEIAAVSIETEINKKQAKELVRGIFDAIAENIAEGHEVSIPAFGKFKRKESKARTGRNPSTGAEIQIPAKKSPVFVPAKELKEDVRDA